MPKLREGDKTLDRVNIMLYHMRAGLSNGELSKWDIVDKDGLIRQFDVKPDTEMLGHVESILFWYISEWAHNEINFAAVLDFESWGSPFPSVAFYEGGCDYTGWGCQSGASIIFANSIGDLYKWALGNEDRQRWGLEKWGADAPHPS